MVLEKDIEGSVVRWALKNGFLAPKVNFIEAGWPDRLFISPHGHTIFIEFKQPGKYPDPLQRHRISQLTCRGIPAFWVDSIIGGITILQAALETETVPSPSDKAPTLSGSGGVISRSGLGQDVDGPSYDKDPDAEKSREAHTDSGAASPSVQSLAGRDRKVGGLPPPTVDGTSWDPEGG